MKNLKKYLLLILVLIVLCCVVFSIIYFIGLIPTNILQGFSVFQKRNKLQLIIIGLTIGLVFLVYSFQISIFLFCLITIFINCISGINPSNRRSFIQL